MQIVLGTKEYINSFINRQGFETYTNFYGKPLVKDNNIYFNKSHAKNLSIAIIDKKTCGIDIELIRNYNELMAKKICSKNEYKYLKKSNNINYDFTLLWVLKESYLKCLGIGISYPLKSINFVEDNNIKMKIDNYSIRVINYNNYIISICRKD